MARRADAGFGGGATPPDLIAAADRGARLAVERARGEGLDDGAIRRRIISRFRDPSIAEGRGELVHETLMAVVQRAVEESLRATLAEGVSRQ